MTKLGFRLLCHWKFRAVVQHVLFPRLLPSACSEGTYVQDFHVTYYVVSLLVWLLLLLWCRFHNSFPDIRSVVVRIALRPSTLLRGLYLLPLCQFRVIRTFPLASTTQRSLRLFFLGHDEIWFQLAEFYFKLRCTRDRQEGEFKQAIYSAEKPCIEPICA